MPRRRPTSAPLILEPVIDYGPAHRRDTERELRPDPDYPNRDTLGAKARDPFNELEKKGTISHEQWAVGDRFRRDIERSGGTMARGGFDAVHAGFGSRVPDDATLWAATRVRQVWAALGVAHSPPIVAIVLHRATMGDYEREAGLAVRNGNGAPRLRAALDVLIDVYAEWQDYPDDGE